MHGYSTEDTRKAPGSANRSGWLSFVQYRAYSFGVATPPIVAGLWRLAKLKGNTVLAGLFASFMIIHFMRFPAILAGGARELLAEPRAPFPPSFCSNALILRFSASKERNWCLHLANRAV